MIKLAKVFTNVFKLSCVNSPSLNKGVKFNSSGRKTKKLDFISPQIHAQRQVWKNFVIKVDQLITNYQYAQCEQMIETYLDQRFLFQQNLTVNQQRLMQYINALRLKSSLEIISRKFDKVLTNIDNQLYLIYQNQNAGNQMEDYIVQLYNQQILVLILHNHQKLRTFLIQDLLKTTKDNKKKTGFSPAMKKVYFSSNLQSGKYIQALGYAVIGQFRRSLQILVELLNKNRKSSQYFSLFLTLLFYSGNLKYFSNKQNYDSQKVRLFTISTLVQKHKIKYEDIPILISPQDSEWMVNSVLGYLNNQNVEWDDLNGKKLNHFFKPLYLISQNYYLNGEIEQSEKIFNKLQSIKPGKEQMKMFYKFMSSMYLYDEQKYKECIQVINLEELNNMKNVYTIHNLVNDSLRKNIFQIAAKSYQKIGDVQASEQLEMVGDVFESVNDLYCMNQLQSKYQENDSNKIGIAPYYLNIQLKQRFGF